DFFALDVRRMLFAEARKRGLWAMTAGPLGFSAAFVAFDPQGMSFDDYCDFRPEMTYGEGLAAFAVAVAPAATQRHYMDLRRVNVAERIGPSAALAVSVTSAFVAMETIAIILGRRAPAAAPSYAQFDLYRRKLVLGKLRFGNRGPLQRLKRWLLLRKV